MSTADLHIHSHHSDGTMTPEEILTEAQRYGVGLLAIADHNVLGGALALAELAKDHPAAKVLMAVEIDTFSPEAGHQHILGYGFDPNNAALVSFLKRTQAALLGMSESLIAAMEEDGHPVSAAEYANFTYDRRGGGWEALHYLMQKGLSASLKEGLRYYGQYDCTYETAGFSSVADACSAIHGADGVALLAHPGEMIDFADISAFTAHVEKLLAMGLDGIECYYPTHTDAVRDVCLTLCRNNGLRISAGSDCHGGFGRTRVGEMDIPTEWVTVL